MTTAEERPANVVVVTHTARLGGAELALERLCSALVGHGNVVRVICFEDGQLVASLREAGVSVDVFEPSAGWTSRGRATTQHPLGAARLAFGAFKHAFRVSMRIRELRPDVVQSWTLKSHLVTTLGLPIHRLPLVWFLHDRVSEDYVGTVNRFVIRELSRFPRVVIANSESTAATLPRPCVVAYPGLTQGQFLAPERVGKRLTRLPAEVLLLGRISPTKGQREAIEAFARVHARYPVARLRIVGAAVFGDGNYEDECRQLVEHLSLGDVVEFGGHSPDPRADLDRASVLLHASPVPEPFGQVVAEAMARGVPVVATDAGGVPELLRSPYGDCGLLVPPSDPDALAAAVIETFSDHATTQARVDVAYRFAAERFRIEETAAVVSKAWREARRLKVH